MIHCPYCHGFEYADQKTGILANGDTAYHFVKLISNLTKDLVILTNGKHQFSEEQLEKLRLKNINVIEKKVESVEHQHGHLKNIIFDDKSRQSITALYARLPFKQHCELPGQLGCNLTEIGLFQIDMFQKTNIEGVFVAGDNSNPARSVAAAAASGTNAGAFANFELCESEF